MSSRDGRDPSTVRPCTPMSQNDTEAEQYETKVPARMDRLPWSRFHWLVILALGATWLLDGLEIGLVGAIGPMLTDKSTLGLTSAQVGYTASIYLVGEVCGALLFGWLTDRYGRQKMFFTTMGLYLAGVALTGLSIGFYTFATFRFLAGLGIGGEYSAVYSAIDELIPAEYRGHADLAISGTYWVGAAAASVLTLFFLNSNVVTTGANWRYIFLFGAALALFVLVLRRYVPESPRWLMVHDRPEEAKEVVENVEERVKESEDEYLKEPDDDESMTIQAIGRVPLRRILETVFVDNFQRAVLCCVLFITQAFLYNAIYFTYGLILHQFYNVPKPDTAYYGIAFAAANFIGAIALGRFFDTVGRRPMISGTYSISGILLAITGYLFLNNMLTALTQTLLWCAVFFFATAAASAAYLTVSEIFPMEVRAQAIAVFFAIGQAAGGVVAPALFGNLIGSGKAINVFYGYCIAAGLMLIGAIVEWYWGIDAAQKSLEEVSTPISTFVSESDESDSRPSAEGVDD